MTYPHFSPADGGANVHAGASRRGFASEGADGGAIHEWPLLIDVQEARCTNCPSIRGPESPSERDILVLLALARR